MTKIEIDPLGDITGSRPWDGERFRALARRLLDRDGDGRAPDATLLARRLFYCDFLAYLELGTSITGATYLNDPRGPWPERLEGELARIKAADGGDEGGAPLGEAELAIVEQVLAGLPEADGSGESSPRRLDPVCRIVPEGTPVAYELAFVSTDPPSEEAIRAGQEVAQRLGLLARAQ